MFQAGGDFGDNFGQRRGFTEAEFGIIGTPVGFHALTQSNACGALTKGFLLVVFLGDVQGDAFIGGNCTIDKPLDIADAENAVDTFWR